jgi:hypothetical protein
MKCFYKIPGFSLKNGIMILNYVFYSNNWGNTLSPYWITRSMAALGGYSFKSVKFGKNTWMYNLPTNVEKNITFKNITKIEETCKHCNMKSWEFAHKCFYGWTDIIDTIGTDTRKALSTFAHKNNITLPNYKSSDWLIYDRCEFGHGLHGPFGVSLYRSIPCSANIFEFNTTGLCRMVQEERQTFLKTMCPNIKITKIKRSSKFIDFYHLVHFPHIVLGSAGSSWATWSAIVANQNKVITGLFKDMKISDFSTRKNIHIVNTTFISGTKNIVNFVKNN